MPTPTPGVRPQAGGAPLIRIVITTHALGCFHVSFASADADLFADAVRRLKENVSARLRSYDRHGRVWNFRPEARPNFQYWLDHCKTAWSAEVVNIDEKAPAANG